MNGSTNSARIIVKLAIGSASLVLAVCTVATADLMSFQTLGHFPGGGFVRPNGISADGSTIAGYAQGSTGQFGFRWTAATGLQQLDPIAGDSISRANDISADGSTIVGISRQSPATDRGVKWTMSSTATVLTTNGINPLIEANGVSADGGVIIGRIPQNGVFLDAAGAHALPGLSPGHQTTPFGISNNGLTIVGLSSDSSNHSRAVRWTQTQGLLNLGILPGFDSSWAFEVSGDGSTVVGWLDNPSSSRQAFRWTSSGGMQSLGTVPGYISSQAVNVSADGSIITGNASDNFGNRAWIWTVALGMQDLQDVLAPVLPADCRLVEAHVSDDGRVLTGFASIGGQIEGWVAVIPEPASGIMLLTGLACCLMTRKRKPLEAK